jgi:CheY-like chemotaxis protein
MDGRNQVPRRHVFAINSSPAFLNVVRELFQEEGYNVTTTNFAPNSFAQIEALQPDALIIDIAIGQEARMPISPASRHLWSRPIPGCRVRGSSRAVNACRLSQLRSAVS